MRLLSICPGIQEEEGCIVTTSVASKLVGKGGLVCGIILTEEMASRAREDLARAGITNFKIRKVDSEIIPYDDHSFDVVMSNGVVELSARKETGPKELSLSSLNALANIRDIQYI